MKLFVFVIGLISAMAFSTGWVFQLLHLPAGAELSIYGFLGFVFLFIPLLVVQRFKSIQQKGRLDKLSYLSGSISAVLVGMSVLFKQLHLQGASTLLVIGAALFIMGFLPLQFMSQYKSAS